MGEGPAEHAKSPGVRPVDHAQSPPAGTPGTAESPARFPRLHSLRARVATTTAAIALSTLAFCLLPAAAEAAFGIEPGSLTTTATNRDGTIDTQAGSHPFAYTVSFKFNLNGAGEPESPVRDVEADLPRGFLGDPLALPRCSRQDFEGQSPACPGNTQVGVAHADLTGIGSVTLPVYNLVPPPGVPARLGFSYVANGALQDASVRTGAGYGVAVTAHNVPTGLSIRSVTETIWGVPPDPSHDPERRCVKSDGSGIEGCSSGIPPKPFLTLPTSCTGPLETTLRVDSAAEPGVFQAQTALSLDPGLNPVGLSGCEKPPFTPTIAAQPETTASDSPTGLRFDLHIPQNEEPEGLAEANLRNTAVTLPQGMAVNPSSADGLAACTEAQIDLGGPGPANCPDAAKIGTVEVLTPLIDHPVPGAVYIARQTANPFHSLLAIYIAVYDPITGVVVKLAGKVAPNPVTGQLVTTFEENPQLPFEDFRLDFFGGPRAPLTTPPTCGHYTTTTDLTPWTAPEGADAFPSDSFTVASGPNGSACAPTPAAEPNKPSFNAGTATPIAGSYSPFVLKLSRENGSQTLKALTLTLPPGLTGKLAGVAECSDAQIAAAAARKNLGEGALEQASPSCPLNSELGTINVGVGSGAPFHAGGHAYLAGPYKGAPLSMAIVTPAVAGPFDLGVVVVRTALYVNPETAQITAKSDPIPTILAGIPLDVRSIAVNVSRNQFTLNPTSCNPFSILGTAFAASSNAALTSPFQVGACSALGFKPSLKIHLKGATKRAGNPALSATVTYPNGSYANIAKAAVTLPKSEFLDNAHIKTVCTRVQFAANQCPAASVYGFAKATTPLLEAPLQGPVYLRSSSHKLPDLVAALKGPPSQPIEVVLDGRVDTGKGGGIRNTFEAIPDAPVSKFTLEMQGGAKGLLENSTNLCKSTNRAVVRLSAQNGKSYDTEPVVSNSCGGKGKGKRGKRHGHRGGGR